MSLYRTWRPKTFTDLVGQDAVVRTLSSALESGKLAHAYLFSGPRGSGKTSAAKILARCIDCVNGPTPTPDNTCDNCLAMLSGTALDVLEIDAASNRGIDEIRALRDAVKFAPSSMRMKVYIIDEAHMLTKEGANAFLKTLEEPPEHAIFILATTEPEKLPVTILSRCQRYAFRRIAIPVMIERMREIADAERIAIDDAALAAIAYRADGGLRDALTMLEQAAAFADGPISPATLDLAFGNTGRNFAAQLVEATLARDAARTLSIIEDASDSGTDMLVLMRSLIASFRNLLVARVDPALLARDLAPEDAEQATARAQGVAQATLVRALRILSDAATLARTGGTPRLELETALLRFVLAGEDPSLDALSARLAALEEGTPRPAAETAAPPSAAARATTRPAIPEPVREPVAAELPRVEPVAPEPVASEPPPPAAKSPAQPKGSQPTLQQVRAAWQNIRGKVESERQSLGAPLSRAAVDAIEGKAVVLRLPDSLNVDILRDHLRLLEAAIEDVLGASLKVTLRVGEPGGTARAKVEESVRAPDADAGDEDAQALFKYANERIKER
ncbi:MAG TPA: DNA polymerase III subunit gamma/tau [Candidatus Dormibacteraeota bacterium]|nr:DNA polymerase III subunit gamma/tau [Candidatus Dormibacteraeota bacterium]